MTMLILGLLLFLGVHSVRIVANDWRAHTIARVGEGACKGGYSLTSALGLGLIVWGYSLARQQPVVVWSPPIGARHLNALFTLAAFILLAAAYVPRNQIRAKLHPMLLAVKLWAFGHLLATGTVASMLLFGSFLLWAICDFRAARQRDRQAHSTYPAGTTIGTAISLVVGLLAWAVFAFWLHAAWLGVVPLGR